MVKINGTLIAWFIITLSCTTLVQADHSHKELWEDKKDFLENEREFHKRALELEREQRKHWEEMHREDHKHQEEMFREELKHQREMEREFRKRN